MAKALKVAVVGATGAVGRQLLDILEKRKFPVSELIPFASEKSKGKALSFGGREVRCRVLEPGCFDGVDLAFFDVDDPISLEWVPRAAQSGCWVIDNSASFRMAEEALLIVPEVNGELLEQRLKTAKNDLPSPQRILANPNCSTAQLVVALKPIHERWGLKRVVVSTYQSTSGAGAVAMNELTDQTKAFLEKRPVRSEAFAHQIAFNCIPQIGGFKENGYTSEESKIIEESRKLLGLPKLRITATAVRVPIYACHSESVNIECERPFEISEIREALSSHAGIVVQDDPGKKIYPMAQTEDGDPVEAAAGRDAVYVGRIRRDHSVDQGLNLWVVSDNLRKGAALNAVQIGEMVAKAIE